MIKLYLIPAALGENALHTIPEYNKEIIRSLKTFFVEDLRSARRFLKSVDRTINIDELIFHLLNKDTETAELQVLLNALLKAGIAGLISEAGCPSVADPGALLVSLAHQKNVHVIPLTGPSSILLALMASGFNGQNFAFKGYLPIKTPERIKAIKQLEAKAKKEEQTQIFIETPFRNNQLIKDILETCTNDTMLCIAANITEANEYIHTKSIREWKKRIPDLHKRPAVFLIY